MTKGQGENAASLGVASTSIDGINSYQQSRNLMASHSCDEICEIDGMRASTRGAFVLRRLRKQLHSI